MSKERATIYVRLLNEGVDVVRPVTARRIASDVFELEGFDIFDPEDEEWEFKPGTRVLVEELQRNGERILLAVAQK